MAAAIRKKSGTSGVSASERVISRDVTGRFEFAKLDVSKLPEGSHTSGVTDSSELMKTPRTRVKRQPARASYDRALAYSILDEALVCSVGVTVDTGPLVIPMAFARLRDQLILHGANKSRLMTQIAAGTPLCVSVTLVDGLVLARSAMHHSLNYRSVVIFGAAVEIVEAAPKLEALARLVEHVMPGRSQQTRPPNDVELKATRVFALPIEEASVKVRSGGPIDEPEDLELPYWAGEIPLKLHASAPISDADHIPRGEMPATAMQYRRG
jgi:hypothetical protein